VPLHVNFDMQNLPADQCNVAIDLERIYRICEQPQRFATPSVVVVDYSMPQMNGLEFCAAIAHLPCKKILFTGAADEKIAVNAFNRGLIDRYIQKSPTGAGQLEQQIRTLQNAYFDDREETLRDLVLLHDYHFLADPVLARLIDTLRVRLGIVEHYVFPNPSGILLIDQNGKTRLLMIETPKACLPSLKSRATAMPRPPCWKPCWPNACCRSSMTRTATPCTGPTSATTGTATALRRKSAKAGDLLLGPVRPARALLPAAAIRLCHFPQPAPHARMLQRLKRWQAKHSGFAQRLQRRLAQHIAQAQPAAGDGAQAAGKPTSHTEGVKLQANLNW
jgi:CheY-like chemotaxis protein